MDILGMVGTGGISALEEMRKAGEVGYPATQSGGGNMAPLVRQDLTQDLIMQALTAEDAQFFRSIYKPEERVKNNVFEYRRQTSIGQMNPAFSGWAGEGLLADETDSEFEYGTAKCRFLSASRSLPISDADLEIVGPEPSMLAKMNQDEAIHLMAQLELGSFDGDDNEDPESINGLRRAAKDADGGTGSNVIDLAGSLPDPKQISEYAVRMREGSALGRPNQVWSSFLGRRALGIQIADQLRNNVQPGQTPSFQPGTVVADKMPTEVGDLDIKGSLYLAPDRFELKTLTGFGSNPPATPALTSVTAASAGGLVSKFVAADAGDYIWVVAAVGNPSKGYRGVTFVASSATPVASGQKVTITITAPNTDSVKHYVLFRSEKNGTRKWKIAAKPQTYTSPGVPAATVFVDLNDERPNTTSIYLIENSKNVLRYREKSPFTRMQLPIPAGTLKFAYAYYWNGALLVTKPACVVRFKNVGTSGY